MRSRDTSNKSERPSCPYSDCPSHADGLANVRVHSAKGRNIRYLCTVCGRTFTFQDSPVRNDYMSAAQSYAVWLIQRGYSYSEATFIVGVSKRTVYRWVKKALRASELPNEPKDQ